MSPIILDLAINAGERLITLNTSQSMMSQVEVGDSQDTDTNIKRLPTPETTRARIITTPSIS